MRSNGRSKLRNVEATLACTIATLDNCNAQNEDYKDNINRLRMDGNNLDKVTEKLRHEFHIKAAKASKYTNINSELRNEVASYKDKVDELKKQREDERREYKETTQGFQEDLHAQHHLRLRMSIPDRHGDHRQHIVADEEELFSARRLRRRILKLT